jgi:hypothetical protein
MSLIQTRPLAVHLFVTVYHRHSLCPRGWPNRAKLFLDAHQMLLIRDQLIVLGNLFASSYRDHLSRYDYNWPLLNQPRQLDT